MVIIYSTFTGSVYQLTSYNGYEKNYTYALVNKMNALKATKGMFFHLHFNAKDVWDNYPTPVIQPADPDYVTNYWDEVLFNQN